MSQSLRTCDSPTRPDTHTSTTEPRLPAPRCESRTTSSGLNIASATAQQMRVIRHMTAANPRRAHSRVYTMCSTWAHWYRKTLRTAGVSRQRRSRSAHRLTVVAEVVIATTTGLPEAWAAVSVVVVCSTEMLQAGASLDISVTQLIDHLNVRFAVLPS